MERHPASFRDPKGVIYQQDGHIYRLLHISYQKHYEHLKESGLYKNACEKGWLIEHQECQTIPLPQGYSVILKPSRLHHISYAWEWSFSMLKDAALLTLRLNRLALQHGMILRDAQCSNIQFDRGKPLFIDSSSFEIYQPGTAWIAYRQFCEQFLAPLALMHFVDPSLIRLLQIHPDGIPLSLCKRLLPFRAYTHLQLLLHIFLQERIGRKPSGTPSNTSPNSHMSVSSLDRLMQGLESAVRSLQPKSVTTTWDQYYEDGILSQDYLNAKRSLVKDLADPLEIALLIDLGANDGAFSRLFLEKASQILAVDLDRTCIERLYNQLKKENITNILPLFVDLSNPSPAIGWRNRERSSVLNRLQGADLVLALALVHHLAIGHNLPMSEIAEMMAEMGTYLMIEFIPKEDPKVQFMLSNREDIFDQYHLDGFLKAFQTQYDLIRQVPIPHSCRTLCLFKRPTT